MKISWGKPSEFKTAISTDGAPADGAEWRDVPMPKDGTLQLTPTEGQETIAAEEGGDPVDVRYGKTTYLFEFDLFTKKGEQPLFDDNDGIVSGEHAFKLLPEDPTCEGIRIDRAKIVATKSYNVADGIITHIKARVLKPAEGKSVKPYVNGLTIDKTALYFSNAADNTGKTVTATSTGNVTATSDQSWCTVTTSGKTATIKVTANSGTTKRTAKVTVTADDKTAVVLVEQIPA